MQVLQKQRECCAMGGRNGCLQNYFTTYIDEGDRKTPHFDINECCKIVGECHRTMEEKTNDEQIAFLMEQIRAAVNGVRTLSNGAKRIEKFLFKLHMDVLKVSTAVVDETTIRSSKRLCRRAFIAAYGISYRTISTLCLQIKNSDDGRPPSTAVKSFSDDWVPNMTFSEVEYIYQESPMKRIWASSAAGAAAASSVATDVDEKEEEDGSEHQLHLQSEFADQVVAGAGEG